MEAGERALRTLEARWFLDGEPDAAFARWLLGRTPRWEDAETRTDIYLLLPGREDLGVKRRGGHLLEVKRRLEVVGILSLDDEGRSEAVLERWEKTSGGPPPEARDAARHGTAVEVLKRRLLGYERLPAGGVGVELTRLEVRGRKAWTLGLEAAPDGGRMAEDLVAFARARLAGAPLPLPRGASRAYPAWLLGRA